jgi:hypothetical protein
VPNFPKICPYFSLAFHHNLILIDFDEQVATNHWSGSSGMAELLTMAGLL